MTELDIICVYEYYNIYIESRLRSKSIYYKVGIKYQSILSQKTLVSSQHKTRHGTVKARIMQQYEIFWHLDGADKLVKLSSEFSPQYPVCNKVSRPPYNDNLLPGFHKNLKEMVRKQFNT